MPTRSHPESARIIREARQAAGLTQLELAEKLGVTIGTIGYYERGVYFQCRYWRIRGFDRFWPRSKRLNALDYRQADRLLQA